MSLLDLVTSAADIDDADIECIRRLVKMIADGTLVGELRRDFFGVVKCVAVTIAAISNLIAGYIEDDGDKPPVFGSDGNDQEVIGHLRELGDAVGIKAAYAGPLTKEFLAVLLEFLLRYLANSIETAK